jgi:pyruvate/2-oxoglutarate dehydrogenase complex dihydrolipoamide dehydrogenase (E3) component
MWEEEMDHPSKPEQYDLVILGSGTGTKLAAWTLGGQGWRVAVIERRYIGGSCPNIACMPSKNVIHSAKVATYIRHSGEFGIGGGNFTVDMAGVRERKRRMVSHSVEVHLEEYAKSGAELILGTARFVAPRTVEAKLLDGSTRVLQGKNVIIGTGTRAALEAIPGLAEAQPLTHVEALELDKVPEHLIVIGGGYVGLEFAQAMRRFGSRVSILDRNDRLMHREDEDVSETLRSVFEDEGIDLLLNTRFREVWGRSGEKVGLVIEQNGQQRTLEGTHLLVAAGRLPNTEDLRVDLAGVALTDRGYVKVNERLETTAPGVWAIGDVAGSPQFTHISTDDFRVVTASLTGGDRVTTGRDVPFCLFTDPEFARIGLSEAEARSRGIRYLLFKMPMAGVLRAQTLSETRGFMKALVARDSGRILGFTAVGVGAGEVMSAVQIAMLGSLPWTALRDAILTHPTLVEGLNALFSTAPTEPGPSSASPRQRAESDHHVAVQDGTENR